MIPRITKVDEQQTRLWLTVFKKGAGEKGCSKILNKVIEVIEVILFEILIS